MGMNSYLAVFFSFLFFNLSGFLMWISFYSLRKLWRELWAGSAVIEPFLKGTECTFCISSLWGWRANSRSLEGWSRCRCFSSAVGWAWLSPSSSLWTLQFKVSPRTLAHSPAAFCVSPRVHTSHYVPFKVQDALYCGKVGKGRELLVTELLSVRLVKCDTKKK